MKDLDFPVLPRKYDRALREAVRYIQHRFKPTAIIAAGTIIRGTPNRNSDLDLWVIHRKPFRQRVQKWFGGVPAEIFVNTPAAVLDHLVDERKERRPVAAHMMVNGHVVLDREPQLKTLMGMARSSMRRMPARPSRCELTEDRYLAGSLYEDALDLAGSDPAACQVILSRAVYEMLHAAVKRARRYVPRDKDLLAVTTDVDAGLGRLARAFFTAETLKDRLSVCRRIADRAIQCRGFIEWESTPVRVSILPKRQRSGGP